MGQLPGEPRSLKCIKPAKKKDYLALAKILLDTQPTEATRRAVEFLIQICSNTDAEAVPQIKWIEEEPDVVAIDLSQPSTLGRICPVMRFRANLAP